VFTPSGQETDWVYCRAAGASTGLHCTQLTSDFTDDISMLHTVQVEWWPYDVATIH